MKQQPTLNVLLADDDQDDCLFFREALKEFSLPTQLTTVHDGEHLMRVLTDEKSTLPEVLFLDLNMPRKNGFECLSEIKANNRLKDLPVIIYSTSFHKKVGDLLYENGASYYISKPSEIAELKKAVQQMVTLVAEKNITRPAKDKFLLTVERKNSKTFYWFKHFFIIPFSEKFN